MNLVILSLSLLLGFSSPQAFGQSSDPASEIPTYSTPDGEPIPNPTPAAPAPLPPSASAPAEAPSSEGRTSAKVSVPVRKVSYRTETLIGLSYLEWNEKMKLQQAPFASEDEANFTGVTLNFEKNLSFQRWGWAYGATLGSGKASGGSGGTPIAFQKGNQPWFLYGAYAKLYQKWSGRLYVGLSLPVFFRQIDWPDQNGIYVTSGKPVNVSLLLEVNLRLNQKWDFYQSLGPFGEQGSTLWRLGLSYRL